MYDDPVIISLCSGYGGLDRAVAATFRLPIGAHAEPEKVWLKTDRAPKLVPNAALRVLEARFPGVPNLGDIREVDWHADWRERCRVLCAGFPCQPVSAAGLQLVEEDERWLWPSVHRAVFELAPEWVVLENVANIVGIRGGEVWRLILGHLRQAGYNVAWGIFGACLVGACHHRHRMFLVARRGAGLPAVRWPGRACGLAKNLALPTPTARDWRLTGPSEINGRNSPMLSAVPLLMPGGDRGRYALGMDRWTAAFGAPPPAWAETGAPGQRGGTRLVAPFPEWMMGLAPGYVTGILQRNDALRAIGNGVMPQQGYHALGELLGMLR
jgi:DNA (cytosine-5)-methyltransferase 1